MKRVALHVFANMARSPLLLCAFAAVTGLADSTNSPPPSKKLVVETFSLSQHSRYFDGQWQGVAVASDGNCYAAVSSHSDRRGAGFFRYNPRTKELAVLAEDVTYLCGENPTNGIPQGKIHSPIVEANGWIYLSTHLALYTPEFMDRYPGSHIIGYELATGKFRDYGALRRGYTTYSAIGVDPARRFLYAFVLSMRQQDIVRDGIHLYRLDLRTGRKRDLGLVKPGGTDLNGSYWFFVDRRGDCWFTMARENGTLFRVRAGSGRIDRWNNVLPRMTIGPHREPVARQGDRHWTWAQALPDRGRCVFAMGLYENERESSKNVYYGDEQLWEFDPARKIETGEAFRRIGYIGPNFLGVTLGGNRVYFVQSALGADRDAAVPPATRSRIFERRVPPVFLRSLPLDATEKTLPTDHGIIVSQDGRECTFTESLAADDKGRVFLVGDFTLLPGEPTMQRFHERRRIYYEQQRGLFLGVTEIR